MVPLLVATLGAVVFYLSAPLWSDLLSALRHGRGPEPVDAPDADGTVPRLLFLVPAHNEEALIAACVRSLLDVAYPEEARRVVVVADNSDDATAEIARSLGAECLERTDLERRGKPHAIRWALERVGRAWDAVVIVDADTEVDPEFARALAGRGPLPGRAVQAYFGIRNPGESWVTRLADLLNWSTYRFRYPHKRAAGLNCPMTGNGMCIGREVLERHPWRTTSLTENWELYAEYTASGVTIDYARDALLYSQEARSLGQSQVQRRRWTAGRFEVLARWWRRVLGSDRIGAHQKLDCLAELSAPSPVLHLAAVLGIVALCLLLPPLAGLVLATAAIFTLAPQVVGAALAFRIYPRKREVLAAFLRLPVYLGWRCWVLLRTVLTPREGWTRSERHVEAGTE